MQELISVIVPVYNTEKYLNKCLDSIVNQSYSNLEIILVDDGSTDSSGKICDDYALNDNRVKVIHKQNEGQSVARNLALKIMKGDYVCFIDSDDWVEIDYVKDMYKEIIKGYDVCFCNINDKSICTDNIYKLLLEDSFCGFLPMRLYKANLFKDIIIPRGRYAEDATVIYKVLYGAKITICYKDLYNYYSENPNNSSNNKKNIFKNTVDRAIMFIDRYCWVLDKDFSNKTKDIVLSKAVSFSIGTCGLYKKSNYNKDDLLKIKSFFKLHRKEIKRNKFISTSRKFAVIIIRLSPRLYYLIKNIFKNQKITG